MRTGIFNIERTHEDHPVDGLALSFLVLISFGLRAERPLKACWPCRRGRRT